MKRLLLIALLATAPTSALANCVITRLANLNPGAKDWLIIHGDMKPTLEPGTCILADLAYSEDDVAPVAIIVLRHPVRDGDFIKRVIATGGRSVQMRDGAVFIDGKAVQRQPEPDYSQVLQREYDVLPRCPASTPMGETCMIAQHRETLGDTTFRTLDLGDLVLENTGVFQVPHGHVFVLGDHRDNSTDSRVAQEMDGMGFIPVANITGVVTYP